MKYIGNEQKVAYTTASAASTAFAEDASFVRLVATTDCFITFAASPTATNSKTLLKANEAEYFEVPRTGTMKVAAIRSTANGNLHITEFA